MKTVRVRSAPPPRHPRSAEAREAILGAAERSFARAGLAGARIDSIASRAGVNKALLYYYFGSKEKLYEAVIEDHFREFNLRALKVLEAPGSARSILLQYVGLHFDFISARHRYASLYHQTMTAGNRLTHRILRKYFRPRSRAFARLLERGMKQGEFRKADRFHAGISIVALIVFYFSAAPVLRFLGRPDAYSPESLRRRKREVLQFIRHGLFVDPASS